MSDDPRLTSNDVSVAYIGPKSRTERPRKIKIGSEVARVTRDSDTTFNVKGQLAGAGAYCGSLAQLVICKNSTARTNTSLRMSCKGNAMIKS